MDIVVVPFTANNSIFNGLIYIANHEHDDNCVLSSSEENDATYTRFISYNQCGGPDRKRDVNTLYKQFIKLKNSFIHIQ